MCPTIYHHYHHPHQFINVSDWQLFISSDWQTSVSNFANHFSDCGLIDLLTCEIILQIIWAITDLFSILRNSLWQIIQSIKIREKLLLELLQAITLINHQHCNSAIRSILSITINIILTKAVIDKFLSLIGAESVARAAHCDENPPHISVRVQTSWVKAGGELLMSSFLLLLLLLLWLLSWKPITNQSWQWVVVGLVDVIIVVVIVVKIVVALWLGRQVVEKQKLKLKEGIPKEKLEKSRKYRLIEKEVRILFD